jgi:hypothetical protein
MTGEFFDCHQVAWFPELMVARLVMFKGPYENKIRFCILILSYIPSAPPTHSNVKARRRMHTGARRRREGEQEGQR